MHPVTYLDNRGSLQLHQVSEAEHLCPYVPLTAAISCDENISKPPFLAAGTRSEMFSSAVAVKHTEEACAHNPYFSDSNLQSRSFS